MQLPQWLTLAVAAMVVAFGIHRIRVSRRPEEDEQRARARGGLYGMSRRAHLRIGILYLLLGAGLIATSLGWNPLGALFAPGTP